jgi:Ser/Thr protein kinase RdoA (MazF antagonist)
MIVNRALSLLNEHRAALTRPFDPAEMVVVHGDITGENMVLQKQRGRVTSTLVDLGEAAVGPAQLDVARFSVVRGLDEAQERAFVKAYLNGIDQAGHRAPEIHTFMRGVRASKVMAVFDLCFVGPLALRHESESRLIRMTSHGLTLLRDHLADLHPLAGV